MKKIIFFSLIMLVSLSAFSQDLLSKIPKDAISVTVLKGSRLLSQVSEQELMQYQFTHELFSNIDHVSSFKELGLDLHRNFYYFITLTDSISYNCMLMPLRPGHQVSKVFAGKEIKRFGDYKGVESSNDLILWDQSTLLFASPFGLSPKIQNYGVIERSDSSAWDEEPDIEEVEYEETDDIFVEKEVMDVASLDFDRYDILEKVVTVLDDEDNLFAGKRIFEQNCAPCHNRNGSGLIGPNHTDKYWLHGGSPNEIFHTIANGVPNKGMVSWKKMLTPREIQQVMSYVRSLDGTKPKNPKAPQGDKYDRSMEANHLKYASIEEQVALVMADSPLTGSKRNTYKQKVAAFLYKNSGLDSDLEEEEVVMVDVAAETEEVEEVAIEEEAETEEVDIVVKRRIEIDPQNHKKALTRAFAINILSSKDGPQAMTHNLAYLAKMNKKAAATIWGTNYGEIYNRVLGFNSQPLYGYPRGVMGKTMNAVQRMKAANASGIKTMTANLYLNDDNAEIEILSEVTDEMAAYSKKMSKRKFNKDFFRYFDGDKVMGYWGLAVNVENTVDAYPKILNNSLQSVLPDQEALDLGLDLLSIILDAEEIGELIHGDMMFVISDLVEKEVKYTSYEYDDDFFAVEVEKTKMEPSPEFLFMMSTEKLDFFKKAMLYGKKHKNVTALKGNLFKVEANNSFFPLEIYVVLKDNILFLSSSEYQARDIANGKKGKLSRKHRKMAKNKNLIFYANTNAILSAIPDKAFPDEMLRSVDYLHTNFNNIEASTSKIKGNISRSTFTVNTSKNEGNALKVFFGIFDELFRL